MCVCVCVCVVVNELSLLHLPLFTATDCCFKSLFMQQIFLTLTILIQDLLIFKKCLSVLCRSLSAEDCLSSLFAFNFHNCLLKTITYLKLFVVLDSFVFLQIVVLLYGIFPPYGDFLQTQQLTDNLKYTQQIDP